MSPVHPRIRGERGKDALGIEGFVGSSPHTRGTLAQKTEIAFVFRFIPAYAGNA